MARKWSFAQAARALIVAVLLAGCASLPEAACPPVKRYDRVFAQAFADQLAALSLPENWAIAEALSDYYVLRRMAEACR
jgi:hypothetical protein